MKRIQQNDFASQLTPEQRAWLVDYWRTIRADKPKFYPDTPPTADVCPTCGGAGWVLPNVPPNDPRYKPTACPANCATTQERRAEQRERLVRYAALPPEYAWLTFDTWDAMPPQAFVGKEAARAAAALFVMAMDKGYYVSDDAVMELVGKQGTGSIRNWLVFYGVYGTGKTGLAAAIVNHVTGSGGKVMYIRLQDYLDRIKARFDRRDDYGDEFGASVDDVENAVLDVPLLVVDEVSIAKVTDWTRDRFEKLVRYRHGKALATVMTTNWSPDEFEAKFGGTVASVVKARAHWLEVGGTPLREAVNVVRW